MPEVARLQGGQALGNPLTNDRETFNYDTLGRLTTHTRIIDNRPYTMSYSNFDAFHRPGTATYPNLQTAVTTYDRAGPNSLSNSGTSLISDIRYNGKMQLTYLDRTSGGFDTTYLYHPQNDVAGGGLGDSNFRLKTIQHGAAGTGNAWPDFSYEYDKVGTITDCPFPDYVQICDGRFWKVPPIFGYKVSLNLCRIHNNEEQLCSNPFPRGGGREKASLKLGHANIPRGDYDFVYQ